MAKYRTFIVCILLITVAIIAYLLGYSQNKPTNKANELQLAYKPIIVDGVTNEERQNIETLISEFESYQYQKSPDRLLALFTPPATKDEQNDLDFMLGKDLSQSATKPLPRLFSTQGYNYTVSGHLIREIRKTNANINVSVDELRTIYSGGEYVGYVTKIENLVFELKPSGGGYKISRYYYSKSNAKLRKYEGFVGS